jgi:hypothetical protein
VIGVSIGVAAAVSAATWRDPIIRLFLGTGKSSNGGDDDGDMHADAVRILKQCWPLFCACQVSNAVGKIPNKNK